MLYFYFTTHLFKSDENLFRDLFGLSQVIVVIDHLREWFTMAMTLFILHSERIIAMQSFVRSRYHFLNLGYFLDQNSVRFGNLVSQLLTFGCRVSGSVRCQEFCVLHWWFLHQASFRENWFCLFSSPVKIHDCHYY